MKVKVNDQVQIIAGKDKGKTGKVLEVQKSKLQDKKETLAKVKVEGVNVQTRHQKPRGERPGGILKQEGAIAASNVMVICPNCQRPTRISYNQPEGGKKVRVCKKCQKEFA